MGKKALFIFVSLLINPVCAELSLSPNTIRVDSGMQILDGNALKGSGSLEVVVEKNASCILLGPVLADEIVVEGLGTVTLGGEYRYAGRVVLNEGKLIIALPKSLDSAKCKIQPSDGVVIAFQYPISQHDIGMISPDRASVFTLVMASDSSNPLDFNANAGLSGASLGASGQVTYSGKFTPFQSVYRLGGGGGELFFDTVLEWNCTMIIGGFLAPSGLRVYYEPKNWARVQSPSCGTVVLPESPGILEGLIIQYGTLKVGAKIFPPAPLSLTVERIAADRVKLAWQNEPLAGSAVVVEMAKEGDSFLEKLRLYSGKECVVSNLPPNEKILFRVFGMNDDLKSRISNVVGCDTTSVPLEAPALLAAVGTCKWVDFEWKDNGCGHGTLIQQSVDGRNFEDAKSVPAGLTRASLYIPDTGTRHFRIATLDADRKTGPWSNIQTAQTDATADVEKMLRRRFQLDDGSRIFNPGNPAVMPLYSVDERESQRRRGSALIHDFKARIASDMTCDIPSGIYRLPSGALALTGLTNVTVRAARVTFILEGTHEKSTALFMVESSKDIQFVGPMVLTTDVPYYSVGRVVRYDLHSKTVELDILPGYSTCISGKGVWYSFDASGRMLSRNKHESVQRLGERRVDLQRVNSPANDQQFVAVAASDVTEFKAFALAGRDKINENITLKAVTCYGFGAPADRVKGYVKYIDYRVLPQPGTSQLFCSWPGQFGHRDSALIFDGCEFNTGGDDGINLMAQSGMATAQTGPRSVALFRLKPEVGESLRFYDFRTMNYQGEGKVVSIETCTSPGLLAAGNHWLKTNRCGRSNLKEMYLVKLDRDVRIGAYAHVYAPDNGASELIVRNCYFRDMNAQAILVQACQQGIIAHNLFERSTAHAIALSSSGYWMEGYWPRNVAIVNNVIRDNCSMTNRFETPSIEVGCSPAVPGKTLALIENCDIDGNRIYNAAYSSIALNYGKNCRVVRNELVNSGVMDSNSAAIKISGGEQVEVRDNVIRYGASGARTWMTFAPDVRRENVSISGNRVFDDSGREETAPLFPYLYGSDGHRALWLRSGGTPAETFAITLDPARAGLEFEGIGALSAGASSRLLMDYPEPQRSEILDLLFKPGYAAALHHFKVEIGGDCNSTDGCEPSHMRTREDLDCTRGYEWWLMAEARKRNPHIFLDALAWGAPGWVGDGKYYSQDMADYVAKFLQGAKQNHGLTVNYTGIWNERRYDIAWIKLLRKTLDANGLGGVEIVAADQNSKQWKIAEDMAKDRELAEAVAVIGEHYPRFMTSEAARASGRRLWSNEDGPWNGTWSGAQTLAKMYNRNYIIGKMTKTIIWSLITSYYDNLPLPGSGLMKANMPWCGAYEIQPALWATAHTTLFAQPGWKYLAGDACSMLPGDAGSVVSLLSPDGKDISLIVETVDRNQFLGLEVRLPSAFASRTFNVWRSDANEQFIQCSTLTPQAGVITVDLAPQTIYSISTTAGQRKTAPVMPVPKPFPSPYRADFEDRKTGQLPHYCSDQAGIFEVVQRSDGQGQCLQQVVTRRPIEWQYTPDPMTLLGEMGWQDQTVTVKTRLPSITMDTNGFVAVLARLGKQKQRCKSWNGYAWRLYADGSWELRARENKLAQGKVAVPGDAWHELCLSVKGRRLTGVIDGKVLCEIEDSSCSAGMVGLGSGWHQAQFDDLAIEIKNGGEAGRGN